jgi:gliding motility-associated-like protein
MARFYPDKRSIAAKDPYLLDSIYFTNSSENASSYKWLLSNDQGMAEQTVSTGVDLNYIFKNPANYSMRLVAIRGGCSDTTEKFNFKVQDATPDGIMGLSVVECYQQTKVKVSFYACNYGYAPFLPHTPITFYAGDPRTANASKLGTFWMPDSIKGQCCGSYYDTILDARRSGVNQIFAVFNDNGTTVPLALPNTNQHEKEYANNVSFVDSFQFKVSVKPTTASLEPGDTLQLIAKAGPGNVSSIVWSTAENINCTNCPNPFFVAKKDNMIKKVIATSDLGCIDSAFVDIKVVPADDYTVTINDIKCSANDSLYASFSICNHFKRGGIPKDLKVSFYDADPTTAAAHLLGPVFITEVQDAGKCASYTQVFKGTGAGKIFAAVNDNGINIPVQLPEDSVILEKDYTNNITSFSYQPDTISLQPSDTTVSMNQSFPIQITSTVYNASTIHWLPGDGYTLSCTDCSSPVVNVKATAAVKVEMVNQHGCTISGEAKIKVIPPDMTIRILQTNCFTNDSLLVRFKICMNNDYDSILKNVPVAFYDGVPATGNAKLLGPLFSTGNALPGNCDTFSTIIRSPSTQNLYAVVNGKGQSVAIYDETDFSNNTDTKTVVPFAVTVSPGDTTAFRSAGVQLIAQTSGGEPTSFSWEPSQYLSCSNCPTPIATPPYSLQFKLDVHNEYACIATGYANIKTFTGGKVNIPNGFTPNADGRNDVFYILGSSDIRILKDFSIFNRWGQKIFQVANAPANDPGFGWNGFINGKEADAGTYVYFVKISFKDGTEQLYKGTVTLIR